ncbi:hypothetical protein PQU92_10990 [Asticcacaulis sp. BYS171W]|uniref:Uncharacterized protein n=1 Tax=Asticcacaulis aquaticus TaxID=2984212 RepID=A0ABT5HUQ2_9CAUL|nr:hypothetical protein [Asticcacaulis aquaticus]MDC7683805.1 hypothetical protein [Asticcacaulis aquaticus]
MKMPILRLAALVLTLFAGTAILSPAQAQDRKAMLAAEAAAENVKAVSKLVEQYGLPCEVTEASKPTVADATVDGKKAAIEIFEVVCKDQRGYILYKAKNAPFGNPQGCLEAAAVAKTAPGSPTCKLKGNRAAHYWLGDTAKSKIPSCALSGARFIRADQKANTELYEIGCKNTAGGIFVVPTHKATDKTVAFYNCLKTAETALKCELTTPEVAPQTLAALLKKNAPDCVLTNARFGGATKDSEYYEVGCKDKAGFVLVTDTAGEFKGAVGCDKAAAIGGCKFTDNAALAAAGKAKAEEAKAKYKDAYAAALTAGGVTCTIEDFRRIGHDNDSKRDLAEFKCAEAPNGLIALIPDAGTTGKLDTFDCFAAATQKTDCTYVTKDQLKANLQKLTVGHKSIKADCVIGEARYAFENNGQVVMEIACVNKRGYIAVLNKARTALNPAVPCHIAATNPGVPEKCTIAGNGSNKEG